LAITLETVTGYIEAANVAILADDFDTAEKQLVLARSSFAVVPDYEAGSRKATYMREDLGKLEQTITRLRNRANVASLGSVQRSNTKYVRTTT